jgi:hypothetical protein
MKNRSISLALVLAVAAAAGVVVYRNSGDAALERALAEGDAMAWLRADFGLTEEQFDAIKTLHDDYSVVCAEHCLEIQKASLALERLKTREGVAAETVAAAERRLEELRAVCESAIATHVRRCAAMMSAEAGERYLALVLPKIKDFDHQAPPDLGVNRHRH